MKAAPAMAFTNKERDNAYKLKWQNKAIRFVLTAQTLTRNLTDCIRATELHPSKKLIMAELKKAIAEAPE